MNETTKHIEAFDRAVGRAGVVRSRHRDRDLKVQAPVRTIVRTEVADTVTPSLPASPTMRR